MHARTYYATTATRPSFAPLIGSSVDVDLAVLGSGCVFGGYSRDAADLGGALLERAASHFHPGLTPVFGQAGLLAAQASYSWAELSDALLERLT